MSKNEDESLGDFLSKLLAGAREATEPDPLEVDDERVKSRKTPSKEQAVKLLKDYLNVWHAAKGSPYKAGDLITPRDGHNIRMAGHPCIVLERLPEELHRHSDGDKERSGVLQIYDIIIARNMGGQLVKFYATSADYEPYVG